MLSQANYQLNRDLDLSHKYKKYASIQREINMVKKDEQNNTGHIEGTPNLKNKIVEKYKRKLI